MNWICTCGRKNSITDYLCAFCDSPQPEGKAPKRISKVSDKRSDELSQYPKKKKAFLLHKMACEVKLPGCTVNATEIHHCSTSALDFLNENTWTAICRSCHLKVETEIPAEERRKLGLLI